MNILMKLGDLVYAYRLRRYIKRISTPDSMYYPMAMPIEDQLDIMIHRTQITERYPFTVVGDQS